MYRELAAARCWFDYSRGWGAEGHSEEVPGCSGLGRVEPVDQDARL